MSSTAALRRAVPLALLASTGLLVTACGSSGSSASDKPSSSASGSSSSSGACDDVKSGRTSDAVDVSGSFGKQQKATFKKPLKASDMERTVLTKGSGETTHKGEQVNTLVTVYLGSGKSLGTQPLSLTVGDSSIPDIFTAGAACFPLGTRSVSTAPAKDVYGAQGNPQAGISADDSLVVVTDLLSEKKPVVPSEWKSNRAKVSFDAKGKPALTLPKTKPAKQLELQVLRKGTGDEVKSGDTVTVDYQGTSWDTGKIFDQSYGRSPAQFGTDQVVPGFGAALVGQKVGTRLVVTIPPKYAYGPKGSGSELAGQTLVFVIEIKDTKTS